MAMKLDGGMVFDRGIDRISFTKGEPVQRMPGNAELPPAEIGMHSELDVLLNQKSLADHLMETFRPHLHRGSMLHPGAFKAVLTDAAKTFSDEASRRATENAAQKQRGARTARGEKARGSNDAAHLRRAANDLREARSLIDYKDEKSSELFLG